LAGSLVLAQAAGSDELAKAIKKLADAGNYGWTMTMESPQFNIGPTTGSINKDGLSVVSRTWGDNTFRSVYQGEKAATETQEGWRSLKELEADDAENRSRFLARMLRGFQPPAAEAEGLLKAAGNPTLAEGAFSGELAEEKVKELLSFRGRGGGGAADVSNAKGSVKFWTENGMLKKYQYSVKGTVSFNDQDRDVDRTTTVEIKDVGSAKVEVPEEAKAKL
jgi:hypothetical protein